MTIIETEADRSAERGGRRYPVQIVVMTTGRQAAAIRRLADRHDQSLSEIIRRAVAAGLPVVARRADRAAEVEEGMS